MNEKPPPIIKEIETTINLGDLFGGTDEEGEHHSLYINIAKAAIEALGTGSDFYWVGNSEGYINFYTAAGYVQQTTTLFSGADGATTYMKVTATWTAPEATVVTDLRLRGSQGGRTSSSLFSQKSGVNQSLLDSQDYIIYWSIHADI